MNASRRALLGALPLAMLARGAGAVTLDRVAKLLVGFPPGGASDIVARLLAERLSGSYAQQVVVENRPGAAARLAIEAVKTAAPDGTTLLFSPDSMFAIYPHIYKRTLRYQLEDFAAVSGVTQFGFGFAVASQHPAQTWEAFVLWARQQAEPIPYASPAAGSTPHFFAEQTARAYGFRLNHVAYRGMAPAYPDLFADRLLLVSTVLGDLAEQQKGGRLRVLAASTRQRLAQLPSVPTMADLGHRELTAEEQFCLLAPGGTPAPIVGALQAAVAEALRHPAMRASLETMGQAPLGSTPQQLASFIRAERDRWGPVVQATGYTVEE